MKNMSKVKLIAYIIVALGGLIMLAPFYFMFIFSSQSNSGILSVPPPIWFGEHLLDNLRVLVDFLPYFWHNLGLSLYIAVVVTVLNLLFCSLAGYAFAMFEFRFKNLMFIGIMATMLLPPFLGMIPTAMIMSTIGWMNDPKALRALQGTAGQVPWGAVSLGATIAVLPLLFLFIMASRRLIDGLTAGAVKG